MCAQTEDSTRVNIFDQTMQGSQRSHIGERQVQNHSTS